MKYNDLKSEVETLTKQNESMKNEISTKSKVHIQKLETENEEL